MKDSDCSGHTTEETRTVTHENSTTDQGPEMSSFKRKKRHKEVRGRKKRIFKCQESKEELCLNPQVNKYRSCSVCSAQDVTGLLNSISGLAEDKSRKGSKVQPWEVRAQLCWGLWEGKGQQPRCRQGSTKSS